MQARWIFLAVAVFLAPEWPTFAVAQIVAPPKPPDSPPLPASTLVVPAPQTSPDAILIDPATHGETHLPSGSVEDGAVHQTHFVPFMLGDFTGPVANLFSDVKIAEGESPRPTDRVFAKFNYYNNVDKDRWTDPTEPIHNVDLYRYSVGMEKTFFDQRVSIGLRVNWYTLDAQAKESVVIPADNSPIVDALKQQLINRLTEGLANRPIINRIVNQFVNPPGMPVQQASVAVGGPAIHTTQFGNLSAVAKGVLWEDTATGSLISAGATISVPTASSKLINPGQSIIAYVQPYGGFILNQGDLFVQGFSSITLPVIHAESVVLFNDVGIGYYVYRSNTASNWLTAVVPTFEVHVATPLHQADPNVDLFGIFDDLKLHNVVDLTLGTTIEFSRRATLAVGAAIPLTGPKPFDVEGIVQFNYLF